MYVRVCIWSFVVGWCLLWFSRRCCRRRRVCLLTRFWSFSCSVHFTSLAFSVVPALSRIARHLTCFCSCSYTHTLYRRHTPCVPIQFAVDVDVELNRIGWGWLLSFSLTYSFRSIHLHALCALCCFYIHASERGVWLCGSACMCASVCVCESVYINIIIISSFMTLASIYLLWYSSWVCNVFFPLWIAAVQLAFLSLSCVRVVIWPHNFCSIRLLEMWISFFLLSISLSFSVFRRFVSRRDGSKNLKKKREWRRPNEKVTGIYCRLERINKFISVWRI